MRLARGTGVVLAGLSATLLMEDASDWVDEGEDTPDPNLRWRTT